MLKIRNKVRLTKKTVKTMEGTFSLDGFGYISLIDWSSLLPIYVVPKEYYLCSLVGNCLSCDFVCGNSWRERDLAKY